MLLSSLSPGATDNILRAGPGFVAIGTNDFKAPFHQHGTSIMPARRLWPDPSGHGWPADWLRQIYGELTPGIGKWIEAMNHRNA